MALGLAAILGGCVEDPSVLKGDPPPLRSRPTDDETPPAQAPPSSPDAGPEAPPAPTGDPNAATACASCHASIYGQWSGSMHARASTSPVVVVQTSQVVKGPLAGAAPDPGRLCVSCHAPWAAAASASASFPLAGAPLAHEGITCVTCHKFDGAPASGSGGLVSGFQTGLRSGSKVFGAFASAAPTRGHTSGSWSEIADPSELCASCHDVNVDRNADGKIVKGKDLVLQTTATEYARYRAAGGAETCVSCHMPSLGLGRAANTARVPEDQAAEAPARALHDHGFVGVDSPLDAIDTQESARAALLRGAATVTIESAAAFGGTVEADVAITNSGAGHNLPTGFAFARQMWLEVRVTRASGAVIDSSGVIANAAADLCDASTFDAEPALRRHFVGCTASDPQLVSFQQKLVDRVDVALGLDGKSVLDAVSEPKLVQHASGRETWLQHLPGGAVPRVRPVDAQTLGTIAPGETRRFSYTLRGLVAPGEEVKVSARLLFRALPPYFLRALGAAQPATETPKMSELPARLKVVEMASATAVRRRL